MGEKHTIPIGEVCSACAEKPNPVSPKWRFNGERWEHHHGYPVGHIPTELPSKEIILRALIGAPDYAVIAMYWPWPDGGYMAGCVLIDKAFAEEQALVPMHLDEDHKAEWNCFDGFKNGVNAHARNETDAVNKLWEKLT